METTFSEWLQKQMDDRGWTQAELARRSKTTTATISRLLSGSRNVGPDMCVSIAGALKLSPDIVYRAAGLLPDRLEDADESREIANIYTSLNDVNREDVLEFARHRLSKQERDERKKNGKRDRVP